jgi:membrane protease YdiL (CAAX protease family)
MPKFFKRGHVPEHLNVPWGPVQGLIVFALVWLGLPIVLILVAGVLAPYVPIVKSFYDGLVNSDVTANFIETVIDAVAGIALVYYFLRRYKVGWKAVALAFYVGALVLLTVVSLLIPSFNANQAQNNDFTGSVAQQHRLISILALVIIPPIIEETVFRGFIFPAFAKKWGTWIGAICSSLLFGFAHLQANVSIYTFLLGMLLCYMYVKLKSVYPGMALHMLNNAIALWAISAK